MIPRIIIRSSGRARPVPSLAGAVIAMIALVGSLLVASPAHAAVGADIEQAVQPASQAVDSGIVKTAAVVGFNAENIISDALFYDNAAMTAAEIQAFLDAKIGTCNNGKCLNVLNAGISSRGEVRSQSTGNLICSAIQGGTMKVSELIYRVQVACGISAKVILVTLQKEQGLTTSKAPSDWNLSAAMGASCPDTAPCDPAFAGVGPQILKGTQQLMTYKAARFGKQPGVNFIGYSPNSACGGTNLNIQNYATAALYTYTPYQPNAAALAAGFGLGNACSAYGNRNFYNYYTQWFGSTQGDVLQILHVTGTSDRYIVSGGSRWRLATAEIAAQFTWIASPRQVAASELSAYTDKGDAKRGIKTRAGIAYLLDSGQRLRVHDIAQVGDLGWDYSSLPVADDSQVERYPDAGYLARVITSGGPTWLIQSGSRREVVDVNLLPRFGIPATVSRVSAAMIADYAATAPVTAVGVYRDATNPYRMQTDAGVYGVPDAASGTAIARSARELTAESFAMLTSSSTMPIRMTSGGRSYVMVDGGWLEVNAADYPATLPFTTLPAGAAAGLPTAGQVNGPHFVRERSDSQTYLVSWGTLQAVSAADQAWVTRTYGVSSRVWPVLDGAIGDATSAEGVVRTAAGVNYLLDGSRAYRLRDCTQVADWGGECTTSRTITPVELAQYAIVGTLSYLVRTPAGTVWLPQSGQMRQVLDPAILSIYGIPATTSAVSSATAARLPVGVPVLAAGVYSDGGAARTLVTSSGQYSLTVDQATGVVASAVRKLTPQSFGMLSVTAPLASRMRSDARSFVLTQEGWLEVPSATYGGDAAFTALSSRAYVGIPIAANEPRPHFVRDAASGQEFLVSSGAAQVVSGAAERAAITARYGVPPKVWVLVAGALSGVTISYDLMVKSDSGEVFLMDGNTRYRTSGCAAAADFGKDCASLRVITAAQLSTTRDGGALAGLLRSPDGYSWLIQSGTKREVPDPRVLAAYGIGTAATPVSANVLNQIRLAAPVVGVGMYDDRAGDVRVITGAGRTFAVPAASRIGTVTAGAWKISPASVDLIGTEGDLPTRIDTGSGTFILTGEGWLAVNRSDYAPLSFTAIGSRGSEGVPAAGAELRPHFIREQPGDPVYLASGGLMNAGDSASRAWISATYGVAAKVWVVPAAALR
ncbi:hypothetical protein [uncultured Microbacterium sp.]|uniref:hypothetical protein n=1 Tax=uncultured Microbacterium sp. TaxID=191216 RepID=UPI00262520B7|nr:hypothetical protein [uncultured Microbacterium sp.]